MWSNVNKTTTTKIFLSNSQSNKSFLWPSVSKLNCCQFAQTLTKSVCRSSDVDTYMFLLRRLIWRRICQLDKMIQLIQQLLARGMHLEHEMTRLTRVMVKTRVIDTCDTDLGIGLTHGLVQRLVVMDVLLQHGDVVTDLRHLAASAPPRHALDVLKYFSN